MTVAAAAQAADPLASWKCAKAGQPIVACVQEVTQFTSADFVPVPQRITVFDNDGTLWSGWPMYFQAFFIFDRIRSLPLPHPQRRSKELFASVFNGDVESTLNRGEHALIKNAMATYRATTTEQIKTIVTNSTSTTKHPKMGWVFNQMIFRRINSKGRVDDA